MNEIFYDIFSDLPRQGPGKNAYTNKAYHIIPALPEEARIVDIGCGTGMQTMELARISFGEVTGIDNYEPFVKELERKAQAEGLENLSARVGDMFDLKLDYGAYDLIWSEGAIFVIGFENGLEDWMKYLKPGGFMVISEMVWFEEHRPKELLDFFEKHVPGMLFQEEQEKIITEAGYDLVESFRLPDDAWWDNYYTPLEARLVIMREKYEGNSIAMQLIDTVQEEINIARKFGDYYGYIFYILMKR